MSAPNRPELLDAMENLMGSEGWQLLRAEMVEQQLSISKQLVNAGDVKDFTTYRELAAQHRQIGAIITWPERQATRLRQEIEQQEGSDE